MAARGRRRSVRGLAFAVDFPDFHTRRMYVPKPLPPQFTVARWVFSRALAVVFFCAFASLLPQVRGLIGAHGIAPAGQFLDRAWNQLGAGALWEVPTLGWFGAGDGVLTALGVAGVLISLLMAAGVAPGACSLALWALYLSLCSVSRPFLDFQWDGLLTETALLAAVALPWRLRPQWEESGPLPRFGRWLLWWLLFRLMLESGLVKLASGDPEWRGLTALDFHFATQPLPLWPAWFAHQAPRWMLRGATLIMFAFELVVPWLILAPRRWRHAGAWALIALQVAILLTGNYAFFNLLTIALCALLFDDVAWPRRWRERVVPGVRWPEPPRPRLALAGAVAAGVVALLSLPPLLQDVAELARIKLPFAWPRPMAQFRSFNGYGLFAVMTTERPEIIVEGSNDGVVWQEYAFSWKVGDVAARPRLAAPHQPRLDWQMWFAALYGWEQNPWFQSFLGRLLEGRPEVLGLLKTNPFPTQPPRYIRSVLYEYHFTKAGEGGAWWRRELKGAYGPELALAPAAGAEE